MLFDTHAHLDDQAFDQDRRELIAQLLQAGIGLVMNPGCSLASSRNAAALAREYDFLYAAVGSHPDAADEVTPQVLDAYRQLCRDNPKVLAIGEIGLDYHYEDIPRQRQLAAFRDQMALAQELSLPVIVHEREAHADGMAVVEEFPKVTGVFHCYSGSAEMAQEYDFLYAAVGSHPDAADEVTPQVLDAYRQLCRDNPKVLAIGEIGLDYHYEDIPRQRQLAAFRDQMALAQELSLPVIVHEREAHADGMAVVEEFPKVTGVFHCYSGSAEMAQWLVSRGWYIGFTGVLTFKNARKAVEVAQQLPLDRIVLETDCPYMSPEPHRGKRNDPSRLPFMAQKLAQLRGLSAEEVAAITAENGRRLNRLPAAE